MLDYARWKYILVSIVLLFSLLFALPNVFGDDRALQLARKDRENITADELVNIEKVFKDAGVAYTAAEIDRTGNALLRFAPWLMKFLAFAGTAAMFLVGGGILLHGVPPLAHAVEPYGSLAEAGAGLVVGIVAGAVLYGVVVLAGRLRGK